MRPRCRRRAAGADAGVLTRSRQRKQPERAGLKFGLGTLGIFSHIPPESLMSQPELRVELFLRWKTNRTFEFKTGADKKPVSMNEKQMGEMMAGMREKSPQMAELMQILVDQAKKDPEGRWVTANNDPLKA